MGALNPEHRHCNASYTGLRGLKPGLMARSLRGALLFTGSTEPVPNVGALRRPNEEITKRKYEKEEESQIVRRGPPSCPDWERPRRRTEAQPSYCPVTLIEIRLPAKSHV